MKKKVENFEDLKKYVICRGDNYNGDRCLVIEETIADVNYNATICFNEIDETVAICDVVDEEGNQVSNDSVIPRLILSNLMTACVKAHYTEKELKNYNFYISTIEKYSSCCDYNCEKCCNKMEGVNLSCDMGSEKKN